MCEDTSTYLDHGALDAAKEVLPNLDALFRSIHVQVSSLCSSRYAREYRNIGSQKIPVLLPLTSFFG
jgi:hypothetical protein